MSRLKTFEAAARLESFTLAARELHLTASAVSHQVKDLEEHFGRPLFVRRNRRVETTLEGRRLYESLARVFDAIEAACAEVRLPTKEQVLAVHCAPSLAVRWLGPRLPSFLGAHPEVNIRLTTGSEPLDLSLVREVDVAISYGRAVEKAGVEVHSLGEERIAPLVSPLLLQEGVSAAELLYRLPLIESQLSQVTWQQWFALNRMALPNRARPSFDRAALAISAAADGMGIALESTRLAAKELDKGELLILGDGDFKKVHRPTHFLSVRTDDRSNTRVQEFAGWLRREAEPR